MIGGIIIEGNMVVLALGKNYPRFLLTDLTLGFVHKRALAKIMNIRQGERRVREYTAEFQALLNELHGYDDLWVLKIFIWGLKPHISQYVSSCNPQTVFEAKKLAKKMELFIRDSQNNF